MFQLKWLTAGVKNLIYWVSGAALLSFGYKLLNTYLKNRAVRKSELRGDTDRGRIAKQADQLEKDWTKQGEVTDRLKDES